MRLAAEFAEPELEPRPDLELRLTGRDLRHRQFERPLGDRDGVADGRDLRRILHLPEFLDEVRRAAPHPTRAAIDDSLVVEM